jgi:RNA polymerase sigma-70 factor (ECF subfamily)
MVEATDSSLVRATLAGDEKAFEALVDKYQKLVFNVAYRMTGNMDESEEITQAVFVKAFEKMGSFNPHFRFFSWIYRITVNETLNFIRHQSRTEELSEFTASQARGPDESYSATELEEKVQAAIQEIRPEYRILVVLKHFNNRSYKEISEILDLPEKTVKSRLYSARQMLKDILVSKGILASG